MQRSARLFARHPSLTALCTGVVARWATGAVRCVRKDAVTLFSTSARPLSRAGSVAAVLTMSRSFCARASRPALQARASSTSSSSTSEGATEGQPKDKEESVHPVVRACKWESATYVERMGFAVGQPFTEDQLRAHFQVLAKHFHPDSSANVTNASAAFQNIKEAYDALLQQVKTQGGQFRGTDEDPGFRYSDEARRRSQMKALGDGVLLFMFMTLIFIVIVARYSKERLNSRYLTSLLAIFFTIQLFPRLLAAAILYACHVSYVIQNTELREQAAVSVIVSGGPDMVSLTFDGIDARYAPDVIVQAEISVDSAGADNSRDVASTTLTFDKGVTRISVPVPTDKPWRIHAKAHDERRRQTLVDKTVTASALQEKVH